MHSDLLFTRRDLLFWLFECGAADETLAHPKYAQFSRDDIEAMLDAVIDLSAAQFDGLAELLDANEPRLENGTVWNHPQLKPALDSYLESGFFSAGFDERWGGMGLPYAIAQALDTPANAHAGTGVGYLFLTAAAANMLAVVGSEAQKNKYLPKMVSGEWFGTMMLSEPQAGSSVGDIRTRAVVQPDGTYHLSGSKMWISGGDQELSANIIHMVLAKIENDDGSLTPGSRGVSLFLVPKYHVHDDGSLGAHNGVEISGLNHKMGQRGIVNTAPVLGADAPCVGELLGAPGKGLAGMFHMMNEARIGIGFSGARLAWNGYRYSLDYARERTQGRPLSAKGAETPQIPIIEHADVRRMLLAQKATAEGGMALCHYAADLVDQLALAQTDDERERLGALLALLTPVVKSWPSMHGLDANHYAIQVLGGYGYTRDYPVERIYRDNRLNEIHEGTTGIQSLDLLGRKLFADQGASLILLGKEITETCQAAAEVESLAAYASDLGAAMRRLGAVSQALAAAAGDGQMELAMANSVAYLDMTGQVVVAWMWLRMALVSVAAEPDAVSSDQPFYAGKRAACQYFFRYELPKTEAQADLLQRLDDTCLEMDISGY